MAFPFYGITKIDILEAFDFQRFGSSAEIVKINRVWHFLVLEYMNSLALSLLK